MQAVMWNALEKAWRFDPDAATAFLFDENLADQRERVDRAQAEQVARDNLHNELPSEDELRQICAAGLAAWMEEEDLSAEFEDDDEDFADGVWQPEDDEPQRPGS